MTPEQSPRPEPPPAYPRRRTSDTPVPATPVEAPPTDEDSAGRADARSDAPAPARDRTDEASEESFPASDPPAHTGATASPGRRGSSDPGPTGESRGTTASRSDD